jgi:hypothetical protein
LAKRDFHSTIGNKNQNYLVPLYEYELCEGDCKVCGGKFTLRLGESRWVAALTPTSRQVTFIPA